MKEANLEMVFESLINGLVEKEFAAQNGLFSAPVLEGLRKNAIDFFNNGLMKTAGIGSGYNYQHNTGIRNDTIKWIEPNSSNVFEQEFFQVIDQLVMYLNRTCYAGIRGYEFHYAVYEPGHFFKRHVDCLKNDSSRKFSVITYLNPGWKIENGGELLAWLPAEKQKILPEFGRTVMFKSNSVEHEVLPGNRMRVSVTGWLRG